ncbi:uncharacterized protein LOC103515431 [Diaphorina citri]|uniref:Uncharacterized protein LOC103515431 n=1 Tax=Diaphorina citri TaxID=121845 RepID=A0A1S3DBU7_DIACI|nr:uncharacterized protein LOC103515431 [Diaphorina citri]
MEKAWMTQALKLPQRGEHTSKGAQYTKRGQERRDFNSFNFNATRELLDKVELGSMKLTDIKKKDAVTRSSVFFIFSTVLLICGEISYMYGHFVFHKKIFTFVAGVVFIISGLMMLIGLVMYISIFKAEVGPKLRPHSPLQPPLFTFSYGYSFLLYVTSFISIELSGTFALFLYIYWYQNECSLDNMQFNSVNQPLYPNQSSYQSGANCRRHHPPYLQPLSIIAQCSPSDVNQRRYYFSRSPSSSREDSPFPRITDISSTYQAELERGGHLDVHYGGWVEEMAYHNSTGWEYSPEDAFVTIDLPLPPDIMDVNQGVGSGGASKKTTLV